jgi:DNA-binding transcriptional LysR family regulator
MPRSVAYYKALKVLPVDLPIRPWPVNIVTLKNRTLSPVVERFIACAREATRAMREGRTAPKR